MRFAKPSEGKGEGIERPDLAEVLAYYGAPNTKRMIPCPLHPDKTPSCSVNYASGLWNCHSCGEGGTSWDLIMKKEGMDFGGARAFAAAQSFADGGLGGGGEQLRGSRYGGGSRVSRKPRDRRAGGGYTPSWRRR